MKNELTSIKRVLRHLYHLSFFLGVILIMPGFSCLHAATPPVTMNQRYTVPGSYTFSVPEGVTSLTIQTWGGGGRGGSRTSSNDGTGGGGGGAFAQHTFVVTPGESYIVIVGAGSTSNASAGGDSYVTLTNAAGAIVLAKGGNSASTNGTSGASGGSSSASIGSVKYAGGNGANRVSSTASGGGGSSAGSGANGSNASGTTGGIAPFEGGNGGNGRTSAGSGTAGSYPGGGGGGAVRSSTGSPGGGAGGHGQVNIIFSYTVDAGSDQTQCNNSLFYVNSNTPPSGYSAAWSVVSGTGYIYDNSKLTSSIIVPRGFSATVRLTVTNGSITATDDVVLTNTNVCTPVCLDPLNDNGDLENSGSITNYNLTFQGTPAALVYQNTNPTGWSEAYGSNTPNTTSFTGAYHLNKTGVSGNPHSGNKFVYMAGNGFCFSALKTGADLPCGKTYKVSAWVAAYSNTTTQSNAPFFMEFFAGGTNLPTISVAHECVAPASTSWNNLNWQHYSFTYTVPGAGYEWSDFVFTTLHNVNGIVIDDMCIEEVSAGSAANAGNDILSCQNSTTMNANTPESGYSGNWSVISGNATISNATSPNTDVTINSGNSARLRWTVSANPGTNTILALDPKKEGGFEICCNAADNGWTTVNHSTNQWQIGSVSNPSSGNRAAYISNNGGTSYTYTLTTSQTSHFYRDITIPPDASNLNLSFKWKAFGQSGSDRILVFTAPTTVTPVAGTPASSSTSLSGATLISSTNLHSSYNYQIESISLPNALAGTEIRLIFTWQNNSSSGVTPPASVDEISLSYDLPVCSEEDDVNIAFPSGNSFLVEDQFICPGEAAVLSANGCGTGSLEWSTGSTDASITVYPSVSSSYSVTCTPANSANILLNPGFESTTDLQDWENWDNASITTNGAEVYEGSKAVMINTIGQDWGGVAQGISASPGVRYRVRFYAKTTNTNVLPAVMYEFYNGATRIENAIGTYINDVNYQMYEFFMVAPPNTTWLTIYAEIGGGGQLFLDNWEVVTYTECVATSTAWVYVNEANQVENGEMDNGLNMFNFYAQGGASATISADNTNQLSGQNSARINISNATGTSWHIQLVQNNMILEAGKTYRLSFKAKAASNRVINAAVDLSQSPWTTYFGQDVNLTSSLQNFTFDFIQSASISIGRVVFNLGQSSQTVWIDDVELIEVCSIQEICDNGIDDDGDGLIDCEDPDCYPGLCLSEFNIVSFADMTLTDSDIQGKLLACGNLNFSNFVVGSTSPVGGTEGAVYVQGNFTMNNGAVQGGPIYASGTINLTNVTNEAGNNNAPPPTTYPSSSLPFDCDLEKLFFLDLSENLESQTANGTYTESGGDKYFNCNNLSGIITFNVSTSIYNTGTLYLQNYNNATAIVINVSGTDIQWYNFGVHADFSNNSHKIIWNFPNATKIRACGVGIKGSLLAPDAQLVMENGHIDGNVIVNGYTNNDGTLPCSNGNAGELHTCRNQFDCYAKVLFSGELPPLAYTGCDFHYPETSIIDQMCVGDTLFTYPTHGVSWVNSNPTVLSVNDEGRLIGLGEGFASIYYINDETGCSAPSSTIEIIGVSPSITGTDSICVGQTTMLTASGGDQYLWSTGATTSTISVSPTINTTYTVTVTSALGCSASVDKEITVFPNPTSPTINTITQPTCTVPTGSVSLSSLPAAGSWVITQNPGGFTYSGSGGSYIITGLSPGISYQFSVTNSNNCSSPFSSDVTINNIPGNPVTGGDSSACVGSTANVTPSSGGTWVSSSLSVATITNSGVVTGVSGGSVTLTFTRTSDGCSNTWPFTVNENPTAPVVGSVTQPTCAVPTGSVTLNNLPGTGGYTINRMPGNVNYSGSGSSFTINNLPLSNTYSFKVTDASGCQSPSSASITINGIPANPGVVLDHLGSVCVNDNKRLTGVPSGGVGPFAYDWTGPSGFNSTLDTIDVNINGNYYLTITDANYCTASTSGFVYSAYQPFIVTLNADICEGENVTLDVNSSTAVSYLWSANAGSATTKLVTVTPTFPSSTYTVTVTNNLGCTSVPEMIINVYERPSVSISGPQEICVGETTSLNPASGGAWTSTNPSVASVTNGGSVTGLSAGTATFIFTENVHNCPSSPTSPIVVKAKPVIQLSGPPVICVGDTSQMTPNTGGTWTSTNPSVATITNTGLITGISAGTANFIFTNTTTSCSSNASSTVTVDSLPLVMMNGADQACLGASVFFTVNHSGGTWTSSDTLIATVNNSGIITTIDTGLVTIYYSYSSGVCSGQVSKSLLIETVDYVQFGGPDEICVGQTTFLTPSSGGTWFSSNPSVATISNEGNVIGLESGYASFTFVADSTGCISEPSGTLTVLAKPSVILNGPAGVCVGGTTSFLPFTGGSWTALNPFVATISNNGTVTAVAAGQARFIFTHTETGCVSDTTSVIQVGTNPSAVIDYMGSVCLRDNSQISVSPTGGNPPYTYQWVGPLGFSGNTQIVNIQNNGTYYVTVTDNFGCKTNLSGFVYQRFDPIIVNLNTSVCDGQSTNLSINASNPVTYLWSANAGSATTSSVTVTPTLPSSTYNVTVTNNLGCTGVATAVVNVHPKPVATITGSSNICVGQTTNMSPTTGGVWTSLNPSFASITNSGVVTGTNAGIARFIFTQSSSGCASDTSTAITINARTPISLGGPSSICVGNQTQLLPASGGTWTAINPSIATVAPNGIVTGLSQGIAQFSFVNSQGCASSGTLSVTVNSNPAIVLNGPSQVCIGSTTQFLPSSGGTWVSSYPSVATITSSGLVNGVNPGTAKFIFTNTSTGCVSDSSVLITVLSRPVVSITGSTTICIGATTTLSPTTGGTWTSNNPSVASATNAGLVTGISAGNTAFVFTQTSTGCNSLPTAGITVNSRPSVTITGPNGICLGATTTLSPTTGGTWSSSNTNVATVTSAGVVTGIASGLANFTFTNATTGCISLPTGNVTVYSKPTVSTSSTALCIGGTVNLQPSTGGTWTSLQPDIAIVNNSGIVTGLTSGTAQFVFTDGTTGCVSNPTSSHTVSPKPTVAITGTSEFCQGTTTTLSPTTGGSWISLSPSIASVTNAGIVTGLSNGTARFVFTTNLGCSSDPSEQVIINGKPLASINGPASICVGNTTTLTPATGGTWVSSKTNIATVTPEGIVTGVAAGTVRFVFTQSSTGCSSDSSAYVTVNANPGVGRLGPATICIGQTSQLTPTAGGTWISLTTAVASINNAGLVTGIGAGTASFKFIQSSTGCETVYNNPVTVLARPVTNLTGPSSICIGATSQFTPSSGGTWSSLNPAVATIDQTGIVTGLTQGITSFTFTSQSTGCVSVASAPVTVLAKPSIALNGPSVLCIGSNTQFLPNGGGSWVSSNPAIATISNAGVVTAISQGNTNFVYTDNTTGCSSNPSVVVTVQPPADITISGDQNICLGYNTTLSAATTGVWYSTRTDIAKTTSSGLVTGTAPGKVTFYFVDAFTGCATYLPNDILNVNNCTDPDFNVTMINVPLSGNIQTNDEVPMGTSYQNTVFLVSKPLGSAATITVDPNGNYTFTANMAGSYVYDIMVCLPSYGPNCPVSRLNIQVVNPNTESHNVVPNLDIMYTRENQSVTVLSNANDQCISGLSCTVDPTKMSIVNQPKRGTATLLANGNIVYTPNANTAGLDTLRYQICASNDATNCRSVSQIITVLASNADTTVAAADDFFFTPKGQNITSANVLTNDRGTEGGLLTVTAQGSALSPVSITAGTFYLTAGGDLHFTPDDNFTGTVDIPYTVCNAFGDCVIATAHVLVLENLKLRIRAYLEGALMENGNQKASDNRPLMRDNLRMSPFTGSNYLPDVDPYSNPMTYFDLSGVYTHTGDGGLPVYTTISNPSAVFAVTGQNAIVDWVFVELRSKTNNTNILGTRSALIQRDGDIVDLDGTSPVEFPGIRLDSVYVVVRHRNHFGVMSQLVYTGNLIDFTLPSTPVFDFGTTKNDGYNYAGLAQKPDVVLGYMSMWAGDFDSNGRIKFVNPDDDQNIMFFEVLSYPTNADFVANYNFSYGYVQGDIDLNSKVKYDNPNDDKNILFYQVLFHPLNINFISNFNFISQQVPAGN